MSSPSPSPSSSSSSEDETMVDHDEYCCNDYMLIKLHDVGIQELLRLLFFKNIGDRSFIHCPEGTELEGTLFRRIVIFITVIVIMALKSTSKQIESFGSCIECFLNLWSHYDSFLLLVSNKLRGKEVDLNTNSEDFSSSVGLTDMRVDLDSNIKRGDQRYRSSLAIMASKTAYENQARIKKIVQDHWKMEFIDFYNCWNAFENNSTTQAFMFSDKSKDSEVIILSFRGTSPFSADDWSTDLDLSWYHLPGIGKVHAGFLKALGLQKNESGSAMWPKEIEEDKEHVFAYYKLRQVLREKLNENENARFIVTGHSLGGALAVLFTTVLAFHKEEELLERLEGVYTFGQPRVGDKEFCESMEKELGIRRYFRFVYGNDLVPRIPFEDTDLLFKHFGYCYHFDSFYNGRIVKEEPNKNYFSIKWLIPMYLNAVWEMIRSLIIPFAYGPNYREGLLLLGVRAFGVLFPGASAHCPQDYVNLTRLGSPDIF